MKIFAISLVVALVVFLSPQAAKAQQCATMDMLQEQLQQDPGLARRMADIEANMQILQKRQAYQRGNNVIVIPVVFHVVHNGEPVGTGPNISDAQVLSQLEVLNEDFRRLNDDTVNTPAIFQPFAADTRIEFCLATVSPDGTLSSGINRVNGGQGSWSNSQIQGTLKPSTVWDSRYYLNFWVVNFSNSGLLGYAQFPGGNANTDGVVVGYQYVGRPPHNPYNNSYNGGRTGTHEVGHWLNLRHIWGDGPCSADDFVDDTPLSDASNSGCPVNTNSCTDSPVDFPDMVQNYMDYTTDVCMNIFTIGQADRMQAAIQASRATLLQSVGCTPVPTFPYVGRVIDSLSGKGVEGASIQLQGFFRYELVSDTGGYFEIPNLYGDTYELYAGKWGYLTQHRSSILLDTNSASLLIQLSPGYYDDFVLDFGWETENIAATSGDWVRDVPTGTNFNGTIINPDADLGIDFGDECYMTGNGGGTAGSDDVDGGTVILRSPWFDGSRFQQPYLSFYRWFANAGGSGTPNDYLLVMVDNNTDVDTLLTVTVNNTDLSQWVFHEYRLDQVTTLSDSMRLIVETADPTPGHLVEAGIDLFSIIDSSKVVLAPVASFTVAGDTVCQGSAALFQNTSQNNATSFIWSFPGGTPSTSTSAAPAVQYDSIGVYDVTLIAINAGGRDTVTYSSYITVLAGPEVEATATNTTCFGVRDGQVSVTLPSPQYGPFAYVWSNGSVDSVQTGLGIGFYTVTVTNSLGCSNTATVLVDQPVKIRLTASAVADTNNNGIGYATVSIQGGTKPYQLQWNDPQQQDSTTAVGLTAGSYQVVLTDKNGCQDSITVEVPNVVVSGIDMPAVQWSIQPNPASESVTISMSGADNRDWTLSLLTLNGQQLQTMHLQGGDWQQQLPLTNIPAGVYLLSLTNEDGDRYVQKLVVLE